MRSLLSSVVSTNNATYLLLENDREHVARNRQNRLNGQNGQNGHNGRGNLMNKIDYNNQNSLSRKQIDKQYKNNNSNNDSSMSIIDNEEITETIDVPSSSHTHTSSTHTSFKGSSASSATLYHPEYLENSVRDPKESSPKSSPEHSAQHYQHSPEHSTQYSQHSTEHSTENSAEYSTEQERSLSSVLLSDLQTAVGHLKVVFESNMCLGEC